MIYTRRLLESDLSKLDDSLTLALYFSKKDIEKE